MAPIIQACLPCLRDRFLFFLLTPDAGPGYVMLPLRGSGLRLASATKPHAAASFKRRTLFRQQRTGVSAPYLPFGGRLCQFLRLTSAFGAISGNVFGIRSSGRVGLFGGRGIAGLRKRRGRDHVRRQDI